MNDSEHDIQFPKKPMNIDEQLIALDNDLQGIRCKVAKIMAERQKQKPREIWAAEDGGTWRRFYSKPELVPAGTKPIKLREVIE